MAKNPDLKNKHGYYVRQIRDVHYPDLGLAKARALELRRQGFGSEIIPYNEYWDKRMVDQQDLTTLEEEN